MKTQYGTARRFLQAPSTYKTDDDIEWGPWAYNRDIDVYAVHRTEEELLDLIKEWNSRLYISEEKLVKRQVTEWEDVEGDGGENNSGCDSTQQQE